MPAASAAGIAGELLDRVLVARPDLGPVLAAALAVPFDDACARLAELEATDPHAHHALLLAVAGGYYLHPDVRRGIGYPGQLAQPVNARDYPEYLTEGLLDPVLARGFTHRAWAADG